MEDPFLEFFINIYGFVKVHRIEGLDVLIDFEGVVACGRLLWVNVS